MKDKTFYKKPLVNSDSWTFVICIAFACTIPIDSLLRAFVFFLVETLVYTTIHSLVFQIVLQINYFTMIMPSLLAFAASISGASAVYQGFNYGSTRTDGSAKLQAEFQQDFTTAQGLIGHPGFSSARLYTMIQAGTTNEVIQAIPAAIATKTSLLLGLWASAGEANIQNEIVALKAAILTYGTPFTDLIAGISVGSEDLYRISSTGVANKAGIGAQPQDIVNYISQVRSAIAGTVASGALVGHVDTWTAWVNSSNNAVIEAVDFIGMDAYPYFQPLDVSPASLCSPIFNG